MLLYAETEITETKKDYMLRDKIPRLSAVVSFYYLVCLNKRYFIQTYFLQVHEEFGNGTCDFMFQKIIRIITIFRKKWIQNIQGIVSRIRIRRP